MWRLSCVFVLGAAIGYFGHREPVAPSAPAARCEQAAARVVPAPAAPTRFRMPTPILLPDPDPDPDPVPDPDPPPAVDANQRSTGVIVGRITDARTNEPLAGATIVASGPALGSSATQAAISDDHGDYKLSDLPTASYTVTFYFDGTLIEQSGVGVGSFSPTRLDFSFDTGQVDTSE